MFSGGAGRVRYCNGGHPPPVLVHGDGLLELLETGGALIDMGGLVPFEEGEVRLRPGDRLYLYSDGITEYAAPSGELFGEHRLLGLLAQQRQLPLAEVARQVMEVLEDFGRGRPPEDDVSLLCIEYDPRLRS